MLVRQSVVPPIILLHVELIAKCFDSETFFAKSTLTSIERHDENRPFKNPAQTKATFGHAIKII
jgi:hypothetical protein